CRAAWPELIHRCVTTEAVVTEACHLAKRGGSRLPLDFLLRARIPILAVPAEGHTRANVLMERFADVPMDYADASLVVLAEGLDINAVFTTDRRGFTAYRSQKGKRFALIPER